MRAQDELQLRSERGQALHRSDILVEIGLRTKKPDGGGIIRVAAEQQAVGAIEQGNGVGSVARRRKNFQSSSAKIDLVAIVKETRNFPGPGCVRFWRRNLSAGRRRSFPGQVPPERPGANPCVGPSEIRVHSIDGFELPVAAYVIVVSVRVEHDDGQRSQFAV